MRILFLISMLGASKLFALEATKPWFSMSYNVGQTAAFMLFNKFAVDKNITYVPLHFDAHLSLEDWLGVSFGLVYRYESYNDKGPLRTESGRVRPTHIWTNFNEIFLLAGPRFSPFKTGLEGLYVSTRAGLGTAISPEYWNLSFLLEPEVGYAFAFGNPGFNLTLGAGLLINLPFYENIGFAVPWSTDYQSINGLQIVVHQAIPVLNIGLGFNI